jgi:transcriptional regulator with XRE-family HTH domain
VKAGPTGATLHRPGAGTLCVVDIAELGPFLRSRREAVSPADVGLPAGARRRTPGLRRAELATLAGISVDYLVRLEQGRDRRPSAQVLAALADAMRLGESDRDFLRHFSVIATGRELCPNVPVPTTTVRPTIERMLVRLEPSPAVVLNRLSDALAWNTSFDRLARPVGMLDGTRPNVARFAFGDPRARITFPDWHAVADDYLAALKAETWTEDPYAEPLLSDLHATGAEFTERWNATHAPRIATGTHRVVHPEVGDLRITFETMRLADEGQRMVVYLPADDVTSDAFDQLAGRFPGALRPVAQSAS